MQRHISSLAIPHAHAPSLARPHPPLPSRLHVCVSVSGMGTGAVPRRGGVRVNVTGMLPNQRRARGPGAGIGAARGQFSITRSPGASGEERSRAGGRLRPHRLGPDTGCQARCPSRLPWSLVALFPPPLRSGLLKRGSCRGCTGNAAAGRAADRAGTRRDPGVRLPGGPRDEIEEGARAPPPRGAGRGAREQRPPRRGGAMFPSSVGSSGSPGIPLLGPAPPQWAPPQAVPWRLFARLPDSQCQRPREGRLAPPHPGSLVGGPRSSLLCACVPLPSAPLPNPGRPLWAWGLGSRRRGPQCYWALAAPCAPAAGLRMA